MKYHNVVFKNEGVKVARRLDHENSIAFLQVILSDRQLRLGNGIARRGKTCLGGREGWTKVEVVVKALGSLESPLIIVQIHSHCCWLLVG